MPEPLLIVLLVLAGLILIAVDFYLPGFVLGTIGAVLLLISVIVCYRNHGLVAAAALFIVELAAAIGTGWAAIRHFPKTAMGQKMILSSAQTGKHADLPPRAELVGRAGVAQSILRPSGIAVIDGKRLDVTAESGMIDRGAGITVVDVKENSIIVRKTAG